MGACLIKHTELMGFSKDVFLPSSPFSDPLSIVREKETTMKHVSLSKIKPSALIKIPGLFILGLLAIAFLLFPLAAFAACGQAPAPKATLKLASMMPTFGPSCGGAATSKNATVTGNPANPTSTTGNPVTPNLLAGITNCRFVVVKPGQKVVLHNGDIVVGTISQADKSGKAGNVGDVIFGMVIGGQFRAINGDGNGGHATGILNGKTVNFTLGNGAVQDGNSGKIDTTPNDGGNDAKTLPGQ
jgi:hypothetical protein